MAAYNRYEAPNKKKSTMFAPLTFLLVAAALIFGLGVFFRVQSIEVVGSVSYPDEEVIAASGIEKGDNLFFINRFAASSQLFNDLPFVKSATIVRTLPNKIVIQVEEGYGAAYVKWMGQDWMLTSECKLLGTGTQEQIANLILVENVTPLSPSEGKYMTVDETENLKLTYLKELLSTMEKYGMVEDVESIDMENAASPTFQYKNRFLVKMGANENTDYKLRMFLSALMEMDEYVTGTVDLSEATAVYVSPD